MLNRESILSTNTGRRTKVIDVKPWGDQVRIRNVNAGEQDHIDSLLSAFDKDPMSVTSRVIATACAYYLSDESGNRMFSDADIDKLDALPSDGLTVVFNQGARFNKRTASVADIEKNSEPTPSEDSGTK
jgi:hypothetical protein